jgi:hypothetical protein
MAQTTAAAVTEDLGMAATSALGQPGVGPLTAGPLVAATSFPSGTADGGAGGLTGSAVR